MVLYADPQLLDIIVVTEQNDVTLIKLMIPHNLLS